ncbi:MAG: Gldg family protein [Saprospiraceae bacterium]|nr:Gldg family protein [Saprospiraceae bacterium]
MNQYFSKIVIAILAFIVINLAARWISFRFDLTQNKEFTLSKATRDILKNLDDKVTIKAYFSKDLPVDIAKTTEALTDLLSEFKNISNGQVEYEFISPNDDQAKEEEAMKAGIQPVMINVREKDQAKQLKAFLGMILQYKEKKEVIPLVQPGTAMEYAVTTSIKKLTVTNKPKIGFIQGHGEASLQEMGQVFQSLDILYDVQSVYLTDSTNTSEFKTIVLVKPSDSIPPSHLQALDQYVYKGGNLIIAMNQVEANLQQGLATASSTGLDVWLSTKGIFVDSALVRDVACGSVQVQQQSGFFSFSTPVQLPYLPLIQNFTDHPVTKGLDRIIFQFASPIRYQGSDNWTPLILSSDKSASEKVPLMIDIQKQWTHADFSEKNICMGGLLELKSGGRMIVYGDGDFPVGQGRNQQVNEDNVSLLVNGIDWLSDDTGLIELRTKAVQTRPIKELDDASRSMYKYVNFLLPIGLVLIYSVYRSAQSRRKRQNRMEQRFN